MSAQSHAQSREQSRERRPSVVLLDVDGTLIDSNDAHARAWVDALADTPTPIRFEDVRPLIGMGGDKVMPKLTGIDAESEEGERIAARRRERFLEHYLPTLRPFPGVRELLARLQDEGFTVVVASSAARDELDELLKQAGAESLVEDTTSSSDAERSKPDPDIVSAAVKTAGAKPADCVMVGDTPYDIEAAHRAGVRVIAVRCGGWWSDEDLADADAIYDGPADLLARLDESPLADPADTGDAGRIAARGS